MTKATDKPLTEASLIRILGASEERILAAVAESFSNSVEYIDKRFDRLDNHAAQLDRLKAKIA